MSLVPDLRGAAGEQPMQAGMPALRLLHELRRLLLSAAIPGVCFFCGLRTGILRPPPEGDTMASHRTFWTGALCGAAIAYLAERFVGARRGKKRRFGVIRGKAPVFRIPLKRDEGAGDPAALSPVWSPSRPVFERRGGAPGGTAAVEVQEVPGHPGRQLDHSNAAQQVRSARTQAPAPVRDSQA